MLKKKSIKNKITLGIIYFAAIFWLITIIYPLIFLVQNSFKDKIEFFMGNVWSLPQNMTFTNYINVWNNNFVRYFMNSVFLITISLALLIGTGSYAAYGISRLRFKFSKPVYLIFVAGMTIPVHITLIPIYMITRQMGIYDTLWALIGPNVAFNIPMTIFILTSFMAEFPKSIEEAAYIDGAKNIQILNNIIIPISRPAIVAVSIYNAINIWNDFIFPLVLTSSKEIRPLTLALWNFQGTFSADIPAMMAALILSMIPILILFSILKEKLIEGMVASAVKG